ncbi:MAG TPA: ribosome recycling factor [Thermomicrobiales bacterium]|jgi:ribosome recycling factor
MYEDILQDADDRMHKAVEALRGHLAGIRTGRASTGLIERVIVDYYGTETPLQQLAGISAPEARMLVVTPWDKGSMKAIEKSIRASDLGLNPTNDGQVIRIAVPALTEERRRDLVKIAKRNLEEAHVAVRNIRRDAMHMLKELDEGGDISEDQRRRGEEQIQKLTDRSIADADKVGREKEAEILEV